LPCIQRAEQLSNTLKKIATSEKFTNFHLFYMDFAFQESKLLGLGIDRDKCSSYSGELLEQCVLKQQVADWAGLLSMASPDSNSF
jgi:hypothetical protein